MAKVKYKTTLHQLVCSCGCDEWVDQEIELPVETRSLALLLECKECGNVQIFRRQTGLGYAIRLE